MGDDLVLHEQVLLRSMAFDVEPTPAFSLLLEHAWLLNCQSANGGVVMLAWALLNDAFCTDICALAPPGRVSLGCLLLAVEMGRRVPELQREATEISANLHSVCRVGELEAFLGLTAGSDEGLEIEGICRDLMGLYEAEVLSPPLPSPLPLPSPSQEKSPP